jgi:peptidoglycan/LPS O-acetylase OafA/YrhL
MNDAYRLPALDGRRTELDGLRALAVLGVMYTHFVNDDSALGTLGVYLFFVLSGYLISGILLRSRDLISAHKATRQSALKTFYIRRILRIFPVYYLFLFALWIAGSYEVREQIWWHATFTSNLLFALTPFTAVTAHLWTLAVEEQFYLVWPAIILLTPKRHLLSVLLALIASAPIYRVIAVFFGFSENATGIVTIACLDCLGVGALLAYLENDKPRRDFLLKLGLWSLPVPVLLALLGIPANDYLQNLARTPCAFAFAWIIARYLNQSNLFLKSRVLVAIGVVSYGAYIFHLAAAHLVSKLYFIAFGQGLGRGPLLFVLGVPMTLVIAAASWKFFEQPINSLKSYWPYENNGHSVAQKITR